MPETAAVPLRDLAHARSGDKGNRANIGVIAHDDAAYAWLETHLTPEAVAAHFAALGTTEVRRYALPRIRAFNFVLEHALGGGASRSLRLDTQGKALAEAILDMLVPQPGPSGVRVP